MHLASCSQPLPGQDLEQADCHGAECDVPLSIWASMVPRSAAVAIAEVCGALATLSDAMSHQFSESRCVWNLFWTCGDCMVSNVCWRNPAQDFFSGEEVILSFADEGRPGCFAIIAR